MIKIPVFTSTGEKSEDISLKVADKLLELNSSLIAQALRVEANHIFTKNGKVKTRAEVSGGGKKPWKQKGTGRARAGSNRSPLWRGGGVTFGPTGLNKKLSIPAKMRSLAFVQLLVRKFNNNQFAVIEEIKLSSGKTKDAQVILNKISSNERVILITDKPGEDFKAWNNLALAECKSLDGLLMHDMIGSKKLIVSKKAFELIEKRLENVSN